VDAIAVKLYRRPTGFLAVLSSPSLLLKALHAAIAVDLTTSWLMERYPAELRRHLEFNWFLLSFWGQYRISLDERLKTEEKIPVAVEKGPDPDVVVPLEF
jgi:hypothetical protein